MDVLVHENSKEVVGGGIDYLDTINLDSPIRPSDPFLREALLFVHENRCFYTKEVLTLDTLTVEHIHPRSSGGKDSIGNYVPATLKVNCKKNKAYDPFYTATLVAQNRLIWAPRVLKKYLELIKKTNKPSKQPSIPRPKLIKEVSEPNSGFITPRGLKYFLDRMLKKYPDNLIHIPGQEIRIFYDSAIHKDDKYEGELINALSGAISSISHSDQEKRKYDLHELFYYEIHRSSWYKRKPYVERSRFEVLVDISDDSHSSLGMREFLGEPIIKQDLERVESHRKMYQEKVVLALRNLPPPTTL